ncbi:MAG: MerR family transcriptional regulator [Lachnospiraceae bacterium]|nr:MerR family transcriptional regulator [Lachnospiraceae bacterium]
MKKQYSIHQVAELLGISADAIRLYEKEGMVQPIRSEKNGYRYYETDQIHRIMGIALYRQLDVGLAEIRQLFGAASFEEVGGAFENLIQNSEKQIEQLQQKIEKMRFMKKHLETLSEGIGTYSVRDLPGRYVLYENAAGEIRYEEMKQIISRPLFSYGNFCYHIDCAQERFAGDKLQFVIREPMFDISPLKEKRDVMPYQKECRCLYTVCSVPELAPVHWQLDGAYVYAKEHGISCRKEAYAFYVYSLMQEQNIIDFYEIYIPVE